MIPILQYIIIGYLLLGAGFYFLSDFIMFQPPRANYQDSSIIIKIPVENGTKLSAIYLPNPKAKYTILFSHGNAEDLGQLYPFLQLFHQQGFAILAYDYEGYGTSEGNSTEKNTYHDIQAAYQYLTKTQGISPNRIIVFGRSLGTGPSVYLANESPIKALILESPFVSAYRVYTVIRIFPFDKYPNLDRISHLQIPLLVIHGTKDSIIPAWHGKKIFEASNGFKQAYWVKGADHNNIYDIAQENYWLAIHHFVQQLK